MNPALGTTKYLITNQLQFETTKILSAYSKRWVVEEFFRNAKQLSDMEGATIRSEQGVTLALCLLSWIDVLLHYENYKGTTEGSQKESLTIPSIIRQAQAENMLAFIEKIQNDEDFVKKWVKITKDNINWWFWESFKSPNIGGARDLLDENAHLKDEQSLMIRGFKFKANGKNVKWDEMTW